MTSEKEVEPTIDTSMTAASKNVRYHWFLWWKIEPEELRRQVREYDSLGVFKSARGVSALLLVLSGAVTIIFACVGWTGPWSLVDATLFLGLGAFIYRGHRWAIICAMMFWTLEKVYQLYAKPQYAIMAILWWTIYMQAFYIAYRVEKEKRAAPAAIA
jgi:hypothetical protein